ncbi:MAG: hypothetical protein KC517_09320 [Bacteroidetes bacterium]|nr:hypothetical protein [Bacteroidota bacterium]
MRKREVKVGALVEILSSNRNGRILDVVGNHAGVVSGTNHRWYNYKELKLISGPAKKVKKKVETKQKKKLTCEFCVSAGDYCKNEHKYPRWVCTREPGHSGDHIACGTTTHNLYRWKQVGEVGEVVETTIILPPLENFIPLDTLPVEDYRGFATCYKQIAAFLRDSK